MADLTPEGFDRGSRSAASFGPPQRRHQASRILRGAEQVRGFQQARQF
jgi:hypothetical protein